MCPGCGWCGRGHPAPVPPRALLRAVVARCGGCGKGVPGGGAFRRCEGRLDSGALPPPAALPLGGLSGSATHVLWARVCGSRGPALSPWLVCPVGGCVPRGWSEAVPGGAAFNHCEGRLVSGAVPPPAARPLGRAAGVPRPMFPGGGWCGCGDPAPALQRAPLRVVIGRCRGTGGRPQGGAFRHYEGRLKSGPVPPAGACPLGGLSGSANHVLWARVCGCGGRALSPWLSCPVGGCVPRGWWEAIPGRVAFHRCEGRQVSGAVPPPAARDPAVVPQRALLRAVLARCGGGRRAFPGGLPFAAVRGVWIQGLSVPRLPCPLGGLSGSAMHLLWAQVCGCGGPALSLWLAHPVKGCVPPGWWGAIPGGGGLPSL